MNDEDITSTGIYYNYNVEEMSNRAPVQAAVFAGITRTMLYLPLKSLVFLFAEGLEKRGNKD